MCIFDTKFINFTYSIKSLMEENLKSVLKKFNLKQSELFFLLILSHFPDRNNAKKVGEFGNLKRGNISFIVESLLKRDLITQEIDKNDRRSYKLELKENALPIIKEAKEIIAESFKIVTKGIPEEELKNTDLIFEKMYENIKNQKVN